METNPASHTVPSPSEVPPMISPTKSRKKRVLAVLLLISGFGVSVISAYLAGAKSWLQPTSLPTKIPLLSSPTPGSKAFETELVFLKDRELWYLDKNSQPVKLPLSEKTNIYEYSQAAAKIAFISGKEVTYVNNHTDIEPHKVVLYDPANNVSNTIFELLPTKPLKNNTEYLKQIRDIGFSKDGALVGITTSDSFLIYDLASDKLTTVFEKTPDDTTRGIIYAYANPIFSPERNYAILDVGYYEGSSQVVVNLSEGEVKELPYSAYVSGTKAIDWIGNTQFLVVEYTDVTSEATESNFLYFVDATTLEKKKTVSLIQNPATHVLLGSDSLIYYIGVDSQKSGKKINDIELFERYNGIYEVNTAAASNNPVKTLYRSLQSGVNNQDSLSIFRLYISPKKVIYVSGTEYKNGEGKQGIYKLTNGQVELVAPGSFE